MIANNFYDKYWNFNNSKFLKLLENSKKALKNKKTNKKSANIEITLFNSVSEKELWKFINKLSTFINSWIDIKWALNIVVKQTKNTYMKKIVNEIKVNIDHWIWISESMMSYPDVFNNLIIALISVWEKTWTLWRILWEIDKKLIETIELKWKVKWALIYPVILLWLTFAMVTFMMIVIIPKITEAFNKTWTDLPYMTQLIIDISNFFRNDWYFLLWAVVWFFVLLKLTKKTYHWALFLWKVAINLPVFGYIIRQSNIIYFINSFSLLMESWVLLLDSLKTSSLVVSNIHYKKEIIRIKNEVENGLTISKSLGLNLEYDTNVYLNELFPEDFAYIVNTWEETWTLASSLKKIGYNYNYELKRYISNLATMLEPIIIIIVWFLVWTIVISIMLPFFKLWEIAKKM